jgi:hypothetical protein
VTGIGEPGTTLAVTSARRTLRLLVTVNVVPGSPILVTLMMEALRSSETSVLTTSTQRNIPEEGMSLVSLLTNWRLTVHLRTMYRIVSISAPGIMILL